MGAEVGESGTSGGGPSGAGVRASGDDDGRQPGPGGEGRKRRRVGRRALLIGGAGVVAGLGVGGYAAREDLARWWWRMPWQEKPRQEGAVDFAGAQWIAASPANSRRADRPEDYQVDRVVIHVVQGGYPVALKVFKDPLHGAASHYVVRKDGHVAQMVRELDVAFHAGNRVFNERSIGIEHEGFVDRPESFTDAMYAASARLTAGICRRYGFPADREHIVGHVEVPGTDHTDPGPHWDWERYLRLVREELKRPAPSGTGAAPPATASSGSASPGAETGKAGAPGVASGR
ncbi:N-acetylmuramoyl-L-alanine amidase [Streptomyces sp. NPDC003077]|uniref:N-acetylmuramoyl-L-alanine amidase n=1 Tax=Streptomyces sp. NPDC003077 TaxID=3154443 RepID=UPI0033A1197F